MKNGKLRTDSHIKTFIPVGIQGLSDHTCRVGLFSVDGDDSERIRESENITFGETISGDHCDRQTASQQGLRRAMKLRNIPVTLIFFRLDSTAKTW
jgi:hypothetical protein